LSVSVYLPLFENSTSTQEKEEMYVPTMPPIYNVGKNQENVLIVTILIRADKNKNVSIDFELL